MIDKILPKKLDTSMDLKLTPKDSMIDALNVSITDSLSSGEEGSGDVGVIKNVLGNTAVEGYNDFDLLPDIYDYRILGTVTDQKTKIIYFFVYSNQNNINSIFAYDPQGRLPKSKMEPAGKPNSIRLIMASNRFMFPQDGFVKGDVVHTKRSEFAKHQNIKSHMESNGYWNEMSADAILYFTDGKNEPKKINVYRALLNNTEQYYEGESFVGPSYNTYGYENYSFPEVDDFISACPRTPLKKIKFEFGYDPSFNGSNFSSGSCFTFSYQYVYNDGIESSISPYSDLAVPQVLLSQGAAPYVDYSFVNVCELYIPPANKEVASIKILVREHDTSSFMLIEEVMVSSLSTAQGQNGYYSYSFYNDRILVPVSAETVQKQFDAVPKKAYTQTMSNNRLFYGNYTEGFDNVSVEASINWVYNDVPKETDVRIYVTPSIRGKAEWEENLNDIQKQKKNKAFNGGASYIFDVDSTDLSLPNNSIVRFRLKIAPDKNFHIYNKNGWSLPSRDNNTIDRYIEEGALDQGYPTSTEKNDSYAPEDNSSLIAERWFSIDSSANVTGHSAVLGRDATRPFIIPGGQLSFYIEFLYNGPDLFGSIASQLICSSLTNVLCGIEPSQGIEVLSNDSVFTHEVSLGLQNFDRIKFFGPKINSVDPQPSSNLAYFITPVFPSGDSANPVPKGAPIGYVIPNKVSADFGFQKVKGAQDGQINEVLLSLKKLYEMELFSCIRRPAQDGEWVVLSRSFMNSAYGGSNVAAQKINQFISNISNEEITSLNDYFKLEANNAINIEINDETGYTNFKKQFGYLYYESPSAPYVKEFKYNNYLSSTYNPDLVGVCITDGEAGIGGGPGVGNYSAFNLNNPGSIFSLVRPVPLGESSNQRRIGGYFFNGKDVIYEITIGYDGVQTAQEEPAYTSSESCLPFRKPDNPDATADQSPYRGISTDVRIHTHAYVEVVQKYIDYYVIKSPSDFRTFKSNSFHEFGVVYYDRRGRHGFVNPIGTKYAPGYSDDERNKKGKIDVSIQITSDHPSWADSFRIVHSRSTSVERFTQYTAGGAYVRHNPTTDEFDNIYVSLNYLQRSNVSYSSSFGAKSPEGGLDLYKFSPGDRVRIISYQTSDGATIYPHNYDFEVIDLVDLGDDNNPIHEDYNNVPYYKKGHFLVLKDNPNSSGFDYNAVKSDLHRWGNNCLMEIYTPSKKVSDTSRVFYEISDFIPVAGTLGSVSNLITNGDYWWRPIALNLRKEEDSVFEDIIVDTEDNYGSNNSKSRFFSRYVESMTFSDMYKGDSYGLGRPNIILKEAQETTNESSIIYSDPTAQSSPRIRYSSFNQSLLGFKDLPEVYGSISYLADRGDSILSIQENKSALIPLNRSIIQDASGSELITSSTSVLGKERYFQSQAGCDMHPESIVDVDGTLYFVNTSVGKVFMIQGSSTEEISSIGMKTAIRTELANATAAASTQNRIFKVPAGYDSVNDEYMFTTKLFDRLPAVEDVYPIYVYGCTDPSSCSYDPEAVINDGNCTYPLSYKDCNGNCLNDSDGDGVCDEEEIIGCQDPDADNYDSASTDPGGCIYFGCTTSTACNYDPSANTNDGSCVFPPPYRDCNNNCTQTYVYVDENGVEYDTGICQDIVDVMGIVIACDDPESCQYVEPGVNVFYLSSICSYPQLGFNCNGEPSGVAVDDFVKNINAFGLTYRALSLLNEHAGTNEFLSNKFDINRDGTVGSADLLALMSAYGTTIDPDDYAIHPSIYPGIVVLRDNNQFEPVVNSVGYIDKNSQPLPPVPSTGSEKLKSAYSLMHSIAKSGMTKPQLQYVLKSLLEYQEQPEWVEQTNILNKWFERGRVAVSTAPTLADLEQDRSSLDRKIFAAVAAASNNPPSEVPGYFQVGTDQFLDILQNWGSSTPDPNFEPSEKVFDYDLTAYQAAFVPAGPTGFAEGSVLPPGGTGITTTGGLLDFLGGYTGPATPEQFPTGVTTTGGFLDFLAQNA